MVSLVTEARRGERHHRRVAYWRKGRRTTRRFPTVARTLDQVARHLRGWADDCLRGARMPTFGGVFESAPQPANAPIHPNGRSRLLGLCSTYDRDPAGPGRVGGRRAQ